MSSVELVLITKGA